MWLRVWCGIARSVGMSIRIILLRLMVDAAFSPPLRAVTAFGA